MCDKFFNFFIDIHGTSIENFPTDWNDYNALKYLNIANTQIVTIPDEIWKFSSLETLFFCFQLLDFFMLIHLGGQKINNSPKEIGKLKNLVSLTIDSAGLNRIPTEIGNCTKIKHLNFVFWCAIY